MERNIYSAKLMEDFPKYKKTGKTVKSNSGNCFISQEILYTNRINSAVVFFGVGLNTFSSTLLEML